MEVNKQQISHRNLRNVFSGTNIKSEALFFLCRDYFQTIFKTLMLYVYDIFYMLMLCYIVVILCNTFTRYMFTIMSLEQF